MIDTGNIHDWGSGHFTRVYDIDQSAILTLGMQALQKGAKSALRCGKRKTPVQNLYKPGADFACKPVLKPVPSSLRSDEPVQEASKKEIEKVVAEADASSTSSPSFSEVGQQGSSGLDPKIEKSLLEQAEAFAGRVGINGVEAEKLIPVSYEIMLFLYEHVCAYWMCLDWALELYRWNLVHKKDFPRLLFKSNLSKMLKALKSDSPDGFMPSYVQCKERSCKLCKREISPLS